MKYVDSNIRRGGFTLVELLVVIAIIALIVSILLPALSRAREQAKQVVCRVNLKQQGLAIRMYANDYDGKLPIANEYGQLISKYFSLSPKWDPSVGGIEHLHCPSVKLLEYSVISYGVNYRNVFGYWDENLPDARLYLSQNLDRVPASTFMVADGNLNHIFSPTWFIFDYDTDDDGFVDSRFSVWLSDTFRWQYNGFSPRHRKSGNALFGDHSVRGVPLLDWVLNKDGLWGRHRGP